MSENFPLLYGMLGKLSSEEFYTSTLIMKLHVYIGISKTNRMGFGISEHNYANITSDEKHIFAKTCMGSELHKICFEAQLKCS